ncbi:amidohydrolase family protein [Sphingosinicella rhizophila]|uniref:Amidohydrolase family protein n=1 Tax=Sphingosinicella rhizophila TaxID=3050082 RepID=A0ABU3QB99_9SPHN|nr:amidohydrolase family protein [Sphingosinicella sp. GR2756]MDT9600665.1 amidohydrolase family protein [Sphingosinicella sp. GR2756]
MKKTIAVLAGLAGLAGVNATAHAADRLVIHAGTLIAEPGKPARQRQSIILEDKKIVAIQDGFVAGGTIVDLSDRVVIPGLIDMHVHVTGPVQIGEGSPTAWVAERRLTRASKTVLFGASVAKKILRSGFTTVRNLGDPASVAYDLRDAIRSGEVDGPRMLVSEPQFALSGGDYDVSAFQARPEFEPYLLNRGSCAGVEDCRRAVREEVKRGADVIKLRLSDLAAMDPRVKTAERPEELSAIIDTAHELGRRVAVHTAGVPAATRRAIAAGADTIEHGPLDEGSIRDMAKAGTAFTATLAVYEWAKPLYKRLGITRDFLGDAQASVRAAHAAGVKIVFGTDLMPAAMNLPPIEFRLLTESGLSPAEALRAATMNAAEALGLDKEIGSIAPGKAADIVALDANPLDDIKAMEKVSFVMRAGKIYRNRD